MFFYICYFDFWDCDLNNKIGLLETLFLRKNQELKQTFYLCQNQYANYKFMPNILVIIPDTANIYEVILDGFKSFTPNVKVDFMLSTVPRYKYKNFGEKISNFLSKTFLNHNKKDVYERHIIQKRLENLEQKYDLIFFIHPDSFTDSELKFLKSKTNNFIAYYWDAMAFFPRKEKIIPFFNKVYSFDTEDCRKYNLELLTNFYYYEPEPVKMKNTLFCMSHLEKRRYELFNRMGKYLKENNINFRFMTRQSVEKLKSPYIEYMKESIPYPEMLKLLNHYAVILDIAKPNQAGLSFRIFESLGMNKKIITNNRAVMKYDFYNPNNILVIDFENINIPKSFFAMPFEPINEAIKQKYHLQSFVRTVVSNIKS